MQLTIINYRDNLDKRIFVMLGGYLLILISIFYNEPTFLFLLSYSRTGQTIGLLFLLFIVCYAILLLAHKKLLLDQVNLFAVGFGIEIILILCINFPVMLLVSEVAKIDFLKNIFFFNSVVIGFTILIDSITYYFLTKNFAKNKLTQLMLLFGFILAFLNAIVLFSYGTKIEYVLAASSIILFTPIISMLKNKIK